MVIVHCYVSSPEGKEQNAVYIRKNISPISLAPDEVD